MEISVFQSLVKARIFIIMFSVPNVDHVEAM